jgi:SAM-dependent methyltransferase
MSLSTGASQRREWELAEIERSASEAQHTPDHRLLADERNLRRYFDPPRETAFPLEYVFSLLGDVRGRTVLDFGCGSGENTIALVRRAANVIAIDISPHLIQLAERRLALNGLDGTARFVVASAHDLPFDDQSVDIVVGIAILHHLDLAIAAREVHRVLRPGGRAIFQEPVRDSKVIRALRRAIPYRPADVSPFERPLTSSELDGFAAPFRKSATRAFLLPFVNVIQAIRATKSAIPAAYRVDRAILKRAPWLTPYAGVRVIELTK